MMEDNSTIQELRNTILRLRKDKNDLMGIVVRLAGGERSDAGYTALRDDAKEAVYRIIRRGK